MLIDFEKMKGLVPAIVQDADTLQVLMLGYMNQSALDQTLETKKVTFYSRSKERLWTKGETSGNELELVSIEKDCDSDALLVMAKPKGPTCHLEKTSCFGEESAPGIGFLKQLERTIQKRKAELPEGSYTTRLLKNGNDKIAQKVGEEAVEVVIASKNDDRAELLNEASDLLYHLEVLFAAKEVTLDEVIETLRNRSSS